MIPIMIVEDETILAMQLENFILNNTSYKIVAKVNNFNDAIFNALKFKPSIILMDIHIKGEKDGINTASYINQLIKTKFIYLTAYCDEETISRALETNPCNYLIKPFNKDELKIALKIAEKNYLREKKISTKKGNILFDSEFSYDTNNLQLIYCGEYIHLTKRENQLLTLLINSKNSIVSIYEMENEIWPDKMPNENTRRTLVSRLRSKLNYKFIETIPAIGYRINI